MLTQERKTHLLKILAEKGSIVAKTVSQDLGLSEDTIRRDLRELAKAGHLKRVHGGAVPAAQANAPFQNRIPIASPEKIAIGKCAANIIEQGQVIFVDGGTTALQLARHLPLTLEATIITHSPNIALELLNHPKIEVEIVGGRLFRHSVVTAGAATVAWLERYRPDICFIGVTGVHTQQGFTTGNSEEAEVKRAIIKRSGEAAILASPEKLGSVSSFEVANWRDITRIIVASNTLNETVDDYTSLGCDVATSEKI